MPGAKKDPTRPPFDPSRRLNIYLDSSEDRERLNRAAEAAGMGRQRGTFLARLLDQHAAARALITAHDESCGDQGRQRCGNHGAIEALRRATP